MSTGVVINGYEVRNWHTVSIIELARARKGQGQKQRPTPTSPPKPEKKTIVSNKRSRNVKGKTNNPKTRAAKGQRGFQARELSDEEKQFIVANVNAMPVIDLARTMHRGTKVIRDYIDVQGIEIKRGRKSAAPEPPHLADLVAEAAANPPDPAMDDPTPDAAATDTRVIQVHDLTVTPQRPYTPPAIIFDGVLSELVRPQNVTTVARTVVKLVEAMNAIPGVTASFRFGFQLEAGVRS